MKKKLSRVMLAALALMLVLAQVAMAATDPLSGTTWVGNAKVSTGSGSVKANYFLTFADGKVRIRVPGVLLNGNARYGTYTAADGQMVVNASFRNMPLSPEMTYSIGKNGKTLTLKTKANIGYTFSDKLSIVSPKASKVTVSKKPKIGVTRNVYIYANGVSEYAYLVRDGVIVGKSSDFNRSKKRFTISYSGWTKGTNTLYAYVGACDVNGNPKVNKAIGDPFTAEDKAALSQKKLKVTGVKKK